MKSCLVLFYSTYLTAAKKYLNDSNINFLRCLRSSSPFQKFCFSGNPDDQDKSDILENKEFNFLSGKIGSAWKRFARQFDIEDNKIVDFTKNCKREKDGCFQVFRELTARYGLVKWKPIEMALQELELDQIISNYKSWTQHTHENT